MDKYRESAEKKLKGQHPDLIAKEALVKAEFATKEREYFFDGLYGELLTDYFLQFLNTEPHENKKREFIYSCVLGLGDVKSRMVQYETYGNNIQYMGEDTNG
jgi:hypothetical protein